MISSPYGPQSQQISQAQKPFGNRGGMISGNTDDNGVMNNGGAVQKRPQQMSPMGGSPSVNAPAQSVSQPQTQSYTAPQHDGTAISAASAGAAMGRPYDMSGYDPSKFTNSSGMGHVMPVATPGRGPVRPIGNSPDIAGEGSQGSYAGPNSASMSSAPAGNNYFSVGAGAKNPSGFDYGWDFGAHQGQTFNLNNPAEGAKYVAGNYLSQNHIDPNDPNWANSAAQKLNELYGGGNIFNGAGNRLSYGDEFIDTSKQPGQFFWGSNPGNNGGGQQGYGPSYMGSQPPQVQPTQGQPATSLAGPMQNSYGPQAAQDSSMDISSFLRPYA